MDGPESLGQAIEDLNTRDALPVLTIGVRERVLDAAYREDCAYRIADIAYRIADIALGLDSLGLDSLGLDSYRGATRLFLP